MSRPTSGWSLEAPTGRRNLIGVSAVVVLILSMIVALSPASALADVYRQDKDELALRRGDDDEAARPLETDDDDDDGNDSSGGGDGDSSGGGGGGDSSGGGSGGSGGSSGGGDDDCTLGGKDEDDSDDGSDDSDGGKDGSGDGGGGSSGGSGSGGSGGSGSGSGDGKFVADGGGDSSGGGGDDSGGDDSSGDGGGDDDSGDDDSSDNGDGKCGAIHIAKSGPSSRNVGESAAYSFAVTIPGNTPLSSIQVTDDKCSPALQSKAGDQDALLEQGETWTYTCSRTVLAGDFPQVRNVATARGTPPKGPIVSDTDEHIMKIPAPKIDVAKTGPSTGTVGGSATYTINVSNAGAVALSNVTVTDDKCNAAPVRQSGDVNSNNVLETTETWVYTCSRTLVDADRPELTNIAKATGSGNGQSTTDQDDHKLQVAAAGAPVIDIDKTGPATVAAGQLANYTLTVRNPGTLALSTVTVTDDKCNAAPVRQSGDTNSNNILETTETWVYTCSRTVLEADRPSVTNTATASGKSGSQTATDTDTHVVQVPAAGAPVIDIVKTGPSTLGVGQLATYSLQLTNPGPVALSNVTVTDNKCSAAPVRLSGDVDGDNQLDTTETWLYTCSRTLLESDRPTLTNIATATGTGNGQTATDSDDHVMSVTPTNAPQITLDKSGPTTARVGDLVTYSLKVSIPVDRPLTGVVVSDPRCDSAPVLLSKSGGDSDDILEFGEVWEYRCTHRVVAGDPDPLPNTATSTGTAGSSTATGTDTHSVDILPGPAAPAIEIEKDGPDSAEVGDTVTYRLEVSIPGDRPLNNVTVSDPRCDAGTMRGPQKTGGDEDDALEPGETWVYRCDHTLTDSDPNPFPNTATVAGSTIDTNEPATDTDSHLLQIDEPARVRINKSGPDSVEVGDTIVYTLEVSVQGDGSLTNVVVRDNKCDSAPQLVDKRGGDNDNVLESGETWVYRCTRVAQIGDLGTLTNVASVAGTDEDGDRVRDTDQQQTDVEDKVLGEQITRPDNPPAAVLPFTGAGLLVIALAGMTLMASGASTLALGRRRRRR